MIIKLQRFSFSASHVSQMMASDDPTSTLYALSDQRYCYNCFNHLLDTSPLRCSRCKGAYYCNTDCQRANWKFHKPSCSVLSDTVTKAVNQFDGNQCIETLKRAHRSGCHRQTALILKRIITLLENGIDDAGDLGMELHTICRLFGIPTEQRAIYYYRLWSAPGMVELLLNINLERASRRRIYEKYGRPPLFKRLSERRYDKMYDAIHESSWGSSQVNAVYEFSFYVINTLCRTITDQSSLGPNAASCWDCYHGMKCLDFVKCCCISLEL